MCRAPIPKGRLLEIIASLQRASEGQVSSQNDQQIEEEIESLLPPSTQATATSATTPTSSTAHSRSNTFTESTDGGVEEHATSLVVENDVTTFDSHQERQKNTQDSPSSISTQLPATVDAALSKPLPIGNSLPPLAPPPPPLAPPPPPPFSTPGLITTQRVVQYESSVPLKPLFWKKLQYSALEVMGQDMVWSNTSEPGQRIYRPIIIITLCMYT